MGEAGKAGLSQRRSSQHGHEQQLPPPSPRLGLANCARSSTWKCSRGLQPDRRGQPRPRNRCGPNMLARDHTCLFSPPPTAAKDSGIALKLGEKKRSSSSHWRQTPRTKFERTQRSRSAISTNSAVAELTSQGRMPKPPPKRDEEDEIVGPLTLRQRGSTVWWLSDRTPAANRASCAVCFERRIIRRQSGESPESPEGVHCPRLAGRMRAPPRRPGKRAQPESEARQIESDERSG